MEFTQDSIVAYNLRKKRLNTVLLFGALALLASLIAYYALVLKHSDAFFVVVINGISSHIYGHIKALTLLGLFYTSLVGGLFFVIMPIEAGFIPFLRTAHHPLMLIGIFVGGFVVSYTANYIIGAKLSHLSKRIIGPQKFYKIKGVLNRRGALAIYLFNALPLPSQPLSTILGVFNYNKARFYLFFILGQLTKYGAIALVYHWVRT